VTRRWLVTTADGDEYVTTDTPPRVSDDSTVVELVARDPGISVSDNARMQDAISSRAPEVGGGTLLQRFSALLDRYCTLREARGLDAARRPLQRHRDSMG
jgi:hypothetical protein